MNVPTLLNAFITDLFFSILPVIICIVLTNDISPERTKIFICVFYLNVFLTFSLCLFKTNDVRSLISRDNDV